MFCIDCDNIKVWADEVCHSVGFRADVIGNRIAILHDGDEPDHVKKHLMRERRVILDAKNK